MNSIHFHNVTETLLHLDLTAIEKAVQILRSARDRDASVWLVGNGGSAATASHFANDLVKVCRIRAISIPDQTPTVTAFGNDDGSENMFWGPVGALARGNDVLVAISCSGNSANVVEVARHIPDNHLIILTGPSHNSRLVRVSAGAIIHAEDDDIKVQEDVHLAVCHAIVGELSI